MLKETMYYYFSPTGGSKKAGEFFCNGIAQQVHSVNLAAKADIATDADCEFAVFTAPVYGGRIPSLEAEKLRKLNGTGKKAVTMAVYGTRAYEDALLELNTIVKECGFEIIASAAVIAQHSVVPAVGAGRPDEQDAESIRGFAEKVLEKLVQGAGSMEHIPGNYPYKPELNMPAAPISLEACNQCGKCAAVCPADAVRVENGAVITDVEKCMLCMACVYDCPKQARILPPPLQQKMDTMLELFKTVRKENEYFI